MSTKERSLKPCIDDLFSKNTDYKFPDQAINQAESLKSLSSDMYTDSVRFIYELIQNADDAESSHVLISILDAKYLIIAHNGKPFDEKDLQGLCGINNGTKKKDLEKTGYKGLGFKAVFGKSDWVLICSNREWFRFESSYKIPWNKQWGTDDKETWERENDRQFIYPWQINPIWTTETQVPQTILNYMASKYDQFPVINIILLHNIEEIWPAIDQLKHQLYIFLFLRNIGEITFSTNTIDVVDAVMIAHDSDVGLKKIYFNGKIVSQWLIKRLVLNVPQEVRTSLTKDFKAPEKLRYIKTTEISFAAKYHEPMVDEYSKTTCANDCIRKLRDEESILFSYLPTKITECKFPMLVNANFVTNANREQIHTDSQWNQWLFDELPGEMFGWVKELVMDDRFHFQAYKLIPSKIPTNNTLGRRFNAGFDLAMKHCNFIRNKRNELLRVNEAIIDSTELSEQHSFIDIQCMRKFVIDKFKQENFSCAEHPFINYDSNLVQLAVRNFNWSNAIQMFQTELFHRHHSLQQNKRMIEYFYSQCSSSEVHTEITGKIEQIPFLIDQKNRLRLVKDIYFPAKTIGNSTGIDCPESYVHCTLFDWLNESAQKGIKQWLEKLGVNERTDLTFLFKIIIPNAETYITRDNAIETVRMLFQLFQQNVIGKKELNRLKKLKLLTTHGTLIPAEQSYLSDRFKPRLPLEEYLNEIEDTFLSTDYVNNSLPGMVNVDLSEWRRFFTMLGVHEEIYVDEFHDKTTKGDLLRHGFSQHFLHRPSPYGYHLVDAYSGLKSIRFLEHTEGRHEFAKVFWSYVLNNIGTVRLKQDTRVFWGHPDKQGALYGTQIPDCDYVQWFVKSVECIPTTSNTCKASTSVFLDTFSMEELCGTYMAFVAIPSIKEISSSWISFFDFKENLLLHECFDLLDKIRHDEEKLTENQDRIQKVYLYLLESISSLSAIEQRLVQAESKTLHLLTENNQWKFAGELVVYMENSADKCNLNDVIPCLKLSFENRTHPNLAQLLHLLNVKQIRMNDLVLVDTHSSHSRELQMKLMHILPYMIKWLSHLNFPFATIASLDRVIQQELNLIESDTLALYHNENLVDETNVYHDMIHQRLYITRPWHSETTLMELPGKLCQLLNIPGFEKHIRFLLVASIEEIKKHFRKKSIELPTEKAAVLQETLPHSGIEQQFRPMKVLARQTKDLVGVTFHEARTEQSSQDAQKYVRNSRDHWHTDDIDAGGLGMQRGYAHISCPPHPTSPGFRVSGFQRSSNKEEGTTSNGFQRLLYSIESIDEDFNNVDIVDISSLFQSVLLGMRSSVDRFGEHGGHDSQTGPLGEELVYRYLRSKYDDQSTSVTIIWENEHGESHLPHDIRLIKNGIDHFIEVKTTRSSNQHTFQLSVNQIEAILQCREHYFIYRVYLEQNKMIVLDNIRWRLQHKQHLVCLLSMKPISCIE